MYNTLYLKYSKEPTGNMSSYIYIFAAFSDIMQQMSCLLSEFSQDMCLVI